MKSSSSCVKESKYSLTDRKLDAAIYISLKLNCNASLSVCASVCVCVGPACVTDMHCHFHGACLFYPPHKPHFERKKKHINLRNCDSPIFFSFFLIYFITDDINGNGSAVTHQWSHGNNKLATNALFQASAGAQDSVSSHHPLAATLC